MGLWLITDPRCQMIYGSVQAGDSEVAAAQAVDGGEADWFWQAQPQPHQQLSVHLPFTLADGIWREAAPGRPLDAGQPGGDFLVSEALGRRWWLVRRDGTFALFDLAWYLCDDTRWRTSPRGRWLERQEEYLICTDLREPGGTETWADYRFIEETDWPVEDASVEKAAIAFERKQITWDGEEFR